ncbi:Uncharacterized protein Fot_57012 [Forsythia ovata]|uniref:Terpene synthase N-terminal domain-containing protein n=1 Tax=Forsythia ovata TaxID=205694 RepID=A0ABD1NXU3_9LAMI
MDSQIPASAAPISSKNMAIEDARRSVTYHPSIWGDYFLAYTSDITDILAHEEQERQRLKEEVKKLLAATPDYSLHKLDLIDAIQRLGIGYHFETEIENSLKYIYDTFHESNDIRTCALRFRLLRQQGYYVSSVRAYFKEAKWTFNGYVPTIEEYMEVALVSCAYMMLSTTSLVGMGELATKEAFDWISSEPLFVRASAIVCRLMDDMVGHGSLSTAKAATNRRPTHDPISMKTIILDHWYRYFPTFNCMKNDKNALQLTVTHLLSSLAIASTFPLLSISASLLLKNCVLRASNLCNTFKDPPPTSEPKR